MPIMPAFVVACVGLAAVAGDAAAIEDRPMMRPPSPMLPLSTRPWVSLCGASRFTAMTASQRASVHVGQQLVAGDAGALLTTGCRRARRDVREGAR